MSKRVEVNWPQLVREGKWEETKPPGAWFHTYTRTVAREDSSGELIKQRVQFSQKRRCWLLFTREEGKFRLKVAGNLSLCLNTAG